MGLLAKIFRTGRKPVVDRILKAAIHDLEDVTFKTKRELIPMGELSNLPRGALKSVHTLNLLIDALEGRLQHMRSLRGLPSKEVIRPLTRMLEEPLVLGSGPHSTEVSFAPLPPGQWVDTLESLVTFVTEAKKTFDEFEKVQAA